ncbi:nickel pincer cofactor biosynthesis protein LarC [Pediococcus claussenii]|uniref:Pyridinium-3,5-bisthiocarboxylic acid mononucleotide nickel insertion protein n=1 Tax=Pediococcus claussenii (strain ATCC BAA-344 / DSM 14800 / JCM 18046 / KCTC 3811 / LMG 21948 / P06) TaxID=701521 RepID=G8PBT6_PEDCP|nr:nickel pincer cofactor biosynthesis protein LarC [Pediococcus claussenii]AEV95994.1 hypothetical protein PECL_1781 [Pediococcus claussenii ATCC BAA-344]ANZ69480.1 TIGR00299 family protein [Pediococcus claussenii]ANZ71299.1 TIGR00299 family protein [Pediococcus claussenii]KRN20600.1 hypothetical protein IV79_GL000659 [Pediococcus claussenii]
MTSLFLEPFSGLSGDMLNGLLIDLGGDADKLRLALQDFSIGEYKVNVERTEKSSIYGIDFDVCIKNHGKDTGIKNDFAHHHHHESRGLVEIVNMINGSGLSGTVKEHSINVFNDIAKAEATVHNVGMKEIHFHEIGAIDSIVDIVSFFILWEQLDIDKVYSTPITEGSGTIHVAHGEMPVPVPAVMQLRKNYPLKIIQDFEVKTELVTPTGLALFKEIAPIFISPTDMYVSKVGYGFGKRNTGKFNALRGSLLTSKHSKQEVRSNNDEVIKIEVNIDDQTAEQIGFAVDKLFENGALDVFCTPIQMKKNRPGVLMTVLLKTTNFNKIAYLVFKHTNTAGFRYQTMKREVMKREFKSVEFEHDVVRAKEYKYKDITRRKLEYEDCASVAEKRGWSLYSTYKKLQNLF